MRCGRFVSITLTLALFLTALLTPTDAHPDAMACADLNIDPHNAFRLHIIANSNSHVDQATKLRVRDAVLDFEKELFSENKPPKNAEETKALIMNNAAGLMSAVNASLESRHADYGASLHIGSFHFPDKYYQGELFPSGDYSALRVVLGDGEGKNWWCVMFPPLCISEDTSGHTPDETTAPGTDGKAADEGESEEDKPEFKSIFVEFFDWIAGLFK